MNIKIDTSFFPDHISLEYLNKLFLIFKIERIIW